MAIFDKKKTTYLTYYIVLGDAAYVKQLQEANPYGMFMAPWAKDPHQNSVAAGGMGGAAVAFDAPWIPYTDGPPTGGPNFTYADWDPSPDNEKPFPLNLPYFERHTGGFWGMGGTTITYHWVGQFVYQAPHDAPEGTVTAPPAPTTARRWVDGFEVIAAGGVTATNGVMFSVDASRHVGGRGLAIRGETNWSRTHAIHHYDGGTGFVLQSWERFYVRLRTLPTGPTPFWRADCQGPSGIGGPVLAVSPTGTLLLFKQTQGNTYTFVSDVPGTPLEVWSGRMADDAWHRIDVVLEVNPGGGGLWVHVDGEVRHQGGVHGAGYGQGHTASAMFAMAAGYDTQLGLDVDDWHCAEVPGFDPLCRLSTVIAGGTFEWLLRSGPGGYGVTGGQDWQNGSRVVLSKVTGGVPADTTGVWTGDLRVLNQNATMDVSTATITSASPGAVLAVTTDADLTVLADHASVGAAAFQIQLQAKVGVGAAPSQIGYQIGAGPAADFPIVPDPFQFQNLARCVSNIGGGAGPMPLVTPLTLRVTHPPDTTVLTLHHLSASVELLGIWTRGDWTPAVRALLDSPDAQPAGGSTGPHNFPYPASPWAKRGLAAPISPYAVIGGTYGGNGTGQDLVFPFAVHWLFIRPLPPGGGQGYLWWSSLLASHLGTRRGTNPQLTHLEQDSAFLGGTGESAQQQQFRARIAGSAGDLNQSGTPYQYIAISDPGMRFMLNGAYGPLVGTQVHPLIQDGWGPQFAFLQVEVAGSHASLALFTKAPDQTGSNLAGFGIPGVAGASLQPGSLTTEEALRQVHPGAHVAYSLWKRDDGSGDTGLPGVVAFGAYTGDGAASRSIGISPASGFRPLFAMISAESGSVGYTRDPSHLTTTSSEATGTVNSLGITAGGIDSFSVAAALNASGVVYAWFVVFGGATAGNNGWGTNGTYVPVEPVSPDGGGGGWPPNPDEPTEPEPGPDPGPPAGPGFPGGSPTLPPDFSVACAPWTTYLVNIALARIGVSRQIEDLAVDVSEEAYKARLTYALDVERTLRDFPWPFATRYADLVLVAGTPTAPVNRDWQYAYRAPVDMVFARRLVSPDDTRRHWDPNPPQFRTGADATGTLLYTDQAIAPNRPVHLEYTLRLPCPAAQGDPLFRDALCWKLAVSLALVIARDQKRAGECEAMYQGVLRAAKAVAGNEQQADNITGDPPWITGR